MEEHICEWEKDGSGKFFFCNCGNFSQTKPESYVEPNVEQVKEEETKCRHVWTCLRDRCHNRGNGKYLAYKCELCGKFQRR